MRDLMEMLTYMRPEGSPDQKAFCRRYLEPVMGAPDVFGNYSLIIGDRPHVAFMAHHDTVHKKSGIQVVLEVNGFARSGSNCLGADCTTGVWLILEMIDNNIPGVYVVHAGEELGCVGSGQLSRSHPEWMDYVDAAISFDRCATESIITHQLGMRTASDEFSDSLADALNLPLYPDPTGAYTDSNEYADVIPECTNLSVGYYAQHTRSESQDLYFAENLRERLIKAQWDQLIIARDPGDVILEQLVYDNPREVARLLENMGFDGRLLRDELNQNDIDWMFG